MRMTLRRMVPPDAARRGIFLVIAALSLAAIMTFVAFSVDTGIISLTKTRMQNATDSAALAAAMEITHAISTAGAEVQDVFAYAQEQAADKAVEVADLNGVFVDSGSDVVFGRRYRDPAGNYDYEWNPSGYQVNCVKVTARRDNPDDSQPDGQIPGLFTGMFKEGGTTVTSESIAYIEPRDMVIVHDFSRSMNFDSYYNTEASTKLTTAQTEANLQLVWDDLQPLSLGTLAFNPVNPTRSLSNSGASAAVTMKGKSLSVTSNTGIKTVKLYFESSGSQTFNISGTTTKTGTWQGTGGNSSKRISSLDLTIYRVGSSSNTWTLTYTYDGSFVQNAFGAPSWPWSGGSWTNYVSYVKTDQGIIDAGYQDKYGGKTLLCYLMKSCSSYSECKDLWKTRHYPFHAIKEGHELLCDFLTDLGFDDYLGMVSYDTTHRIETTISAGNPQIPAVNLSATPLSNKYAEINKLMKYKQASHYSDSTNMSGGVKDAIALLDAHKREGSRPAIILMTDGNSNTLDSGETGSLPSGWSWNTLFDYDGNGTSNYSTTDTQRTAVLKYVKQAVDKGYTVHAISVGADADTDLLNAVAWLGDGYYVEVPGGSSISDLEADVKEAFIKIASAVPPARLVNPEE